MADGFNTLPPGVVIQPCPFAQQEQTEYWIEIELVGEDDQPVPWEGKMRFLHSGVPATPHRGCSSFRP